MAEAVSRQRNDHHERAMMRRQLAEEQIQLAEEQIQLAEEQIQLAEEQIQLAEEQIQSKVTAAEALMMLKAANTHFNMSTQASTTVDCDASTQTTEIITITTSTQTPAVTCVDASVQTEPEPLNPAHYSVTLIKESDARTRFYNGLPTWALFQYMFFFLIIHIPRKRTSHTGGMTQQDEFLLVLMRLVTSEPHRRSSLPIWNSKIYCHKYLQYLD